MNMNDQIIKSFISKLFHRFEAVVMMGIAALISVMIIAAFWGLITETYHLVLHGAIDTLDHKTFQAAFGMVMTLLIAMEFNRTIMHAYLEERREEIVKTVVLVSILAVSRQFIVLEMETISPLVLIALAVALLSLGTVYWLMARTPPSRNNHFSQD